MRSRIWQGLAAGVAVLLFTGAGAGTMGGNRAQAAPQAPGTTTIDRSGPPDSTPNRSYRKRNTSTTTAMRAQPIEADPATASRSLASR